MKKEADEIGAIFYSKLEHQRTYETEFPCLRKDGREILCRMKASRIGEKLREKRIVVTYEDITAEKKAQEELQRSREELRNLSIHLQSVREEESTRVARKIHDELGQSLTALQMDLSWLLGRLPTDSKAIRENRGINRLIRMTLIGQLSEVALLYCQPPRVKIRPFIKGNNFNPGFFYALAAAFLAVNDDRRLYHGKT